MTLDLVLLLCIAMDRIQDICTGNHSPVRDQFVPLIHLPSLAQYIKEPNRWDATLLPCSYPGMINNDTQSIYFRWTKTFSKHQPMLSISWNVRPCVHVFVCSLLRYRLNVFLPPLPEVGCPKFLEIRNPWGKVMVRSGLRFENFY